ncbi:hypothetical protein RND81_10G015000 [Saponaria officinalis]|uniref:Uncharacterized protein n=1 Tax=Saponaria officinalis TaxID=3572 RepID=A0AAW1HX84_SAPOF
MYVRMTSLFIVILLTYLPHTFVISRPISATTLESASADTMFHTLTTFALSGTSTSAPTPAHTSASALSDDDSGDDRPDPRHSGDATPDPPYPEADDSPASAPPTPSDTPTRPDTPVFVPTPTDNPYPTPTPATTDTPVSGPPPATADTPTSAPSPSDTPVTTPPPATDNTPASTPTPSDTPITALPPTTADTLAPSQSNTPVSAPATTPAMSFPPVPEPGDGPLRKENYLATYMAQFAVDTYNFKQKSPDEQVEYVTVVSAGGHALGKPIGNFKPLAYDYIIKAKRRGVECAFSVYFNNPNPGVIDLIKFEPLKGTSCP